MVAYGEPSDVFAFGTLLWVMTARKSKRQRTIIDGYDQTEELLNKVCIREDLSVVLG